MSPYNHNFIQIMIKYSGLFLICKDTNMETTRMSKKELRYGEIISQTVSGKLRQAQAALILGLSNRQIKRLCKRYREEGIAGLCHRSRGRKSNNKVLDKKRKQIIELIKSEYTDFGPQLIREQLSERQDILISREWIRQTMIEEGLWAAKKKKLGKVHQRRNRRSRRGELIQVDGSYHHWLEDRGCKSCLLVAIDDATSEIHELYFLPHESTEGYMNLMKKYVQCRGRPIALYSDRLNVFGKNGQFQRALKELDIEIIHAQSPQAKGRVERANGTLQDRLIKLMRLEGISSIEEANEYAEKYRVEHNKKFARAPKDPCDAYRELSKEVNLEKVFCKKESRKVAKDLSIQWQNKIYLLKDKSIQNRLKGKTATIFEVSSQVYIEIEGKEYAYELYEEQPFQTPVMNKKELDAWFDKKPRMTAIERHRKGIKTPGY